MAVRIQLRRDTAANWVSTNPVLRDGELGIETDTLQFKIGNGSAWNSITNYANVVPSDLNTTLGDYVLVEDIGAQGGVVGLNNSYNAIIPGSSIIIEGPTADSYETTLTVTDPTADRTITLPDSDGTVALTSQLPTQYTDELAQDAVAAALAAGTHTNITVTYNDSANTISLAAAPGYVDEQAVDAVAAALAAGTHTNITVTYDDNANSISLTGATTYSDENAQDAVGNAVGTGLSYNDTTGAISVDTTTIQARVADVSDTEIGYLNGVTSAIQTQIDTKAPTNNPTFTGTVTLPGNPSTANEAANKAYVDNISAGLNFHAAVHAATTADLSATYDNTAKTLSASGTFPQIDGHTVAETERVLVKSQSNAVQNGIYTLTDDGDPSGTWVLTRAADADNTPSGEIAYGDFVFVQNGTTNSGYGFIMTTTGTITLGTSNINWTQFNAGQTVIAGNGLAETSPGTFAIDTSITQTRVSGVSDTEIGYLDGVTSAIQTQLDDKSTASKTETLTNKSISLGSNTVTGTLAQFSTAVTDADLVGVNTTQTLQNKTFSDGVSFTSTKYITSRTSPSSIEINSSASTGAKIDLIAATDIVLTPTSGSAKVGSDIITTNTASQTLTNKTLTSPVISTITNTGTLTLPTSTDTLVGRATTDTLTNKVIGATSTTSITGNTATIVDTNALAGFTTVKYVVSIKQGSKIRSSEIIAQTDGTNVDYTEFGITETGGTMTGVLVEVAAVSTNAVLRVTITDAATTNATVKIQEVLI